MSPVGTGPVILVSGQRFRSPEADPQSDVPYSNVGIKKWGKWIAIKIYYADNNDILWSRVKSAQTTLVMLVWNHVNHN